MNNINCVNIKDGKLNIVFLDFDDIQNPLLGAGQAKATLEVGKLLAQRGHRITVISSKFPNCKDRIENGLEYRHIGLGSKNIRLNNIFYILSVPFATRKLKADIIIECFTAPISTLFSSLWTDIPVVALPSSFEAERFSKLYHLPFEKIEKFGCRFYKYFMPYTSYMEEKMRRNNKNIIARIVPEGVENEFFLIKKRKFKYILFLGRLDISQKGIDLLLKSYRMIAEEIKLPLVIAGNGPDEKRVKSLIKKMDLGKFVEMIGPVHSQKKFQVLSEALFVALPSRHEGFSLLALEAMASGLMIVAFDIPGISWANSEVALKVKPFDVEAYAQALKTMAMNRKIALEMGHKGRELARKFTWEKVANSFETFFKEIIFARGRTTKNNTASKTINKR